MKVDFTAASLADVEACVPEQFRLPMLERLQRLMFHGQGQACTSERFPDARFIKFQYWLVMFVPAGPSSLIVIGVEYNYGQEV